VWKFIATGLNIKLALSVYDQSGGEHLFMYLVPGMQKPDGPFLSSRIDAEWVKLLIDVIISCETNNTIDIRV
jgi:hypothetical protein